jgi:hypothetical protein
LDVDVDRVADFLLNLDLVDAFLVFFAIATPLYKAGHELDGGF